MEGGLREEDSAKTWKLATKEMGGENALIQTPSIMPLDKIAEVPSWMVSQPPKYFSHEFQKENMIRLFHHLTIIFQSILFMV